MMGKKFIGIEIGGTKLQLITGTAAGSIEQHMRYTIDPAEGAAGIQAKIMDCFGTWGDLSDIAAIGVGFGGPVNWHTGTIQVSHQIAGWAQFNLKTWLEERTGKPVMIDNDANVAALGESVYGGGKGYRQVFYMTIGSGIGGGMILDGSIYHGKAPGEVEVGHLRLDKSGATLESKCSGWAVNKKVSAYIHQHPDSLLAQLAKEHTIPEAGLLKPALEKEDAAAREILKEVTDDIAFALSHVTHLFHPEIIIIGGGLSFLDEYLSSPIATALSGYLMNAFLPAPPVQISALRENVVPMGALELAKTALK
ncbi:ROK family protein [Chitinophaga sp. MM2321]|uniref:ROK family protein n=1 Tax=Chitinophaga sp. MM2321 TaxID=3137178 RepID=UPI0032D5A717